MRDCIRSVADFCSDHSGNSADGGGQEQAKEGNQIVRAKSVFTGRSVLPSQFLCLGMWIRGGSTCCWAGPLRDCWYVASNSNTIKAHSEESCPLFGRPNSASVPRTTLPKTRFSDLGASSAGQMRQLPPHYAPLLVSIKLRPWSSESQSIFLPSRLLHRTPTAEWIRYSRLVRVALPTFCLRCQS